MTLKKWLEKVDGRLDRVEHDLAEHMRRTDLLERHITAWIVIGKFVAAALGVIATVVGIVVGIVALIKG